MNIHEYQAKAILREFSVPVPRGIAAFTTADAEKAANELGGLFRFRRGERCDPARHRNAEFPQYRFCLIFVDVHSRMPLPNL